MQSDTLVSRSPDLVSRSTSLLAVIDLQERLLPSIAEAPRVVWNVDRLARAAALAGVGVAATEQYPRGLGPTVAPVAQRLPSRAEKLSFSGWGAAGFRQAVEAAEPRQIVLVGVETHVCVLQTAFDLLAAGYDAFVVADACGSRAGVDHKFALRRLAAAGATVVTTESVIFEWCESAEAAEFKQFSALVRETPPT